MSRRALVARGTQLVLSCVVLGVGVALLLRSTLGSDGYSTLVNGATRASGLPFWVVNLAVAVALVAMAWARGTRPGPGTVVQPVAVGLTVSLVMSVVAEPSSVAGQALMLVAAFVLLALGVAGYLATDAGAGPAEAAALAWEPPVPFRWGYGVVQVGGSLVGWLLGADIGVGTVLVSFGVGPFVDLLARRLPRPMRWTTSGGSRPPQGEPSLDGP